MLREMVFTPAGELLNHFVEADGSSDSEVLKKNWRSIVCQTCGACCHSSLVPFSEKELIGFHKRLDIKETLREFLTLFVQDVDTSRPVFTMETVKHDGRCMFLMKDGYFSCSKWEARPGTCSTFFCWPMSNFKKYDTGVDQDMFPEKNEWMTNFNLLLVKVAEEAVNSLFESDRIGYMKSFGATKFAPASCASIE